MIKPTLLLLSALVSANVLASGEPMVQAWLTPTVTVMDEQGRALRQLDTRTLPRTARVVQYNKELDIIQVSLPEGQVWMDTQPVRVVPSLNIVKLPCQSLSSGYSDDHQTNGVIGYGAGCQK